MVAISKKAALLLFSSTIFASITAQQETKPQRNLNYESLYKLHLTWEIEDLNKKLMSLQAQLEANWHNLQKRKNAPQTEKSRIQQENEHMQYQIEQLKNERNFSYHLETKLTQFFEYPRPTKGHPMTAAAIEWSLKEWARFLSAYLFLPISAPLAAFNAREEWLSKKDNETQITALEKKLEENNTALSNIKPLPEDEIARLEAEAAKKATKIETDMIPIRSKIAELELEKENLVYVDEFKANFKPRYMPE